MISAASREWTDGPAQLVLLVKTDDTFGRARLGTTHETKHPLDQARRAAIAESYDRLLASCPDEQPICWTVNGGEA